MTDLYFCFDTEDFTCPYSFDPIREQADILHEYGIRGNFNLVGYVARELIRHRRFDVLEALENHDISTHTLSHSVHPTVNEYCDVKSFEEAYAKTAEDECECNGMIRAATGRDRILGWCPPGNSFSYVSMYFAADHGYPFHIGSFFGLPHNPGAHICNNYQLDYDISMESLFFRPDYSVDALIERIADNKQFVLYNHPNMVNHPEFWDSWNYRKENLRPMYDWIEPPRRSEEQIRHYYDCFRELLDRVTHDPRIRVRSVSELVQRINAENEARVVTKDMMPAIEAALTKRFIDVRSPVRLSIADCFFAAKHFLMSDKPYRPGKVHGFLETPQGVTEETTLTAEEVRKLAAETSPEKFLPPYFIINEKMIGPADLLFAMFAVLRGEETVTLSPRPQQYDLDELPWLRDLSLRGTWMHSDSFEDKYISDRLRLQAWTLRIEK